MNNIPHLFFREDETPVHIKNLYKGGHIFFTVGGPSLKEYDLDLLKHPGIKTFGVNNSPVVFRPDFWTMTDDVTNFCESIYRDPGVMKFLPHPKFKEHLFDNNAWEKSKVKVKECPNVLYYKRGPAEKDYFRTDTFFEQATMNWGNFAHRCFCGYMKEEDDPKLCPSCGSDKNWGKRTVFLVAVRIAYELGFRHIYLLGADMKMKSTQDNYAWKQSRSSGSVKGNNMTYRMMNMRFDALKPEIDKRGLKIYNCTPGSGLKTFPFMDYREAIWNAVGWMPEREHTEGLYDRKAKEKDAKKKKQPMPEQPIQAEEDKPTLRWFRSETISKPEGRVVRKVTSLKEFIKCT
jgi:hypothetical protein